MSRRYWYYYQGSGSETDPTSYIPLPYFECAGSGQSLCAVYAIPSSINPSYPNASELNGTLKLYIVTARLISSYYPVYPEKPYVYLWTI